MRPVLLAIFLLMITLPAAAEEQFVYRAESGDTLIGIAGRLLIRPTDWPRVQRLNRIQNPRRIPVGSKIRIPMSWIRRDPESARVLTVQGRAESQGTPINTGALLPEGSLVTTGDDGYATLGLPDGSELTLQAGSTLRLETLRRYGDTDLRDTSLKLEQGRVETRVAPRRGQNGRFEIRSKVAVAGVRGTEFRVGAEEETARSEVLSGTVDVEGLASARHVRVDAGFGTRVRGTAPPAEPRRLLPAPDLRALPALQERPLVRFEIPLPPGVEAWRAQVASDRGFQNVFAEGFARSADLRLSGIPDGEYWLRVRGVDSAGLEGLDAYHRFRLKARPEPPFPAAPAPDAKLTVGAVEFRWSQPEGANRYRIQVARDADFASVIRDQDRLPGLAHSLEGLEPGRYWWRLASARADGDRGPFGDPQGFTLKPLPPNPDPPDLDETQLRFSWPAEPAQRFLFQLAHDPQFSRLLAERELAEPRVTLDRPDPGSYYMRVRATDPDGYVGPFTSPQRFEVPAPPAQPWWLLLLLIFPLL